MASSAWAGWAARCRGVAAAGLVERATGGLPAETAVVLDVPPNPTETAVHAAVEVYRAERCDGVVALGGGSPIDLAKGVALLATHERPLAQYAVIEGGLIRIGPVVPMIAVPTTRSAGRRF